MMLLAFLVYSNIWVCDAQYMEESEFTELLQTLIDYSMSYSWFIRHGSILTFSSISMHCPSLLCVSPFFTSLMDRLKDALKDDKVH
jgi:hypothetical protein